MPMPLHRLRTPLLLALACACALAHALPATPTIALEAGSDSGTPGDNLTNVRCPWLGGTAPAGSMVLVKDGATLLGTATVNGSGAWRFQPGSDLSEGPHNITAEALVSPAAPSITAIADNVLPTIDSVPNGGATNDNTPTLRGTAEPGSIVSIYDNGNISVTILADGTGNWTFTPPPYP